MPVYNGEKWLNETIESILTQSYKDFDFIIVDDC
jgi:glycosyltransferase involved in cell wall biosynthesis